MVVSAHPQASAVGLALLRRGGTAIDAAVGTALAISVVEPFSAGVGGGGFLLHRDAASGTITALDFRERAPQAAHRTMYLDPPNLDPPNPDSPNPDPPNPGTPNPGTPNPAPATQPTESSRTGHRAVAVPGTIAGLAAAHQRGGKLPWAEVVAPAIALAAEGVTVSPRLARVLDWQRETLAANPAARQIFVDPPLEVGDRLVQHDLAATLRRIAADPQDAYTGTTAQRLVADMQTHGGLITAADLRQYRPIWRDPVCGRFRTERVCAMPPPSSGGVHLLQMLQLLDTPTLATQPRIVTLHQLAEAMKIAYADRATYLGDPDFVAVPTTALIDPAYAAQRRAEILDDRARPAAAVQPADPALLRRLTPESADTSHLSVVDGDRNAVSLTFTINGGFGAGVVAAGTGIVLNNEMDDFAIAPGVSNLYGLVGGDANAIAPGKTPLSSMTPAIVTDAASGDLRLVVGAPGGSTIITTVTQIILNRLVFGQNIAEAIAAPRLHHQWQPDVLRLEAQFDPDQAAALRALGHPVEQGRSWGNANAIQVLPVGNTTYLEGAADPRGEGVAIGD
jgi:gamma-glutamyltranspeptidase/glutathione hydrolase